jgi:hypothetical protein
MSDRGHEDNQLSIEPYLRTIAQLKQEAHLWQARCEEVQCLYNEREDQMAEARAIVKLLTFFKPGECPFCLNDGSTHAQMCLTTRASVLQARMETVDDL